MNLSPLATAFFHFTSPSKVSDRSFFLNYAESNFSTFDHKLFKQLVDEWESCCVLSSCFSLWKKYVRTDCVSSISSLHCLSFNVRGFNHRWNEVLLFFDRTIYYQKGENSFGGVVMLIRKEIKTKRCECKTWNWSDLTSVITAKSVIFGDFNVDLHKDTKTSEILLDWADSCSLAPFIPDSFISLRANSFRTIDYALSNDIPITI